MRKTRNHATVISEEPKPAGFEVLLHHDLNHLAMVSAIDTFTGVITGGDQVVVLFSDYGVQPNSGNYLSAADIEPSTTENELVAFS